MKVLAQPETDSLRKWIRRLTWLSGASAAIGAVTFCWITGVPPTSYNIAATLASGAVCAAAAWAILHISLAQVIMDGTLD